MSDRILARLRKICLSLPDTSEKQAWGHPTFRVGGNSWFASYEGIKGRPTISFKLEAPRAERMERDRRFIRKGALGRHAVVSIDATLIDDWGDVEDMVRESHRLASTGTSATARPASAKRRAKSNL